MYTQKLKIQTKPNFREKLLNLGANNLTDQELIALLLRTGNTKKNVIQLSKEILITLENSKITDAESQLHKVFGMGESKICTILAALELGRRFFGIAGQKISHPSDIVPLLRHYANRKQENFICVSLSGANEIIATRVVSIGILTKTLVHPREVFADPLTDRAAAVIVAHNHPSGTLQPSQEDIALTKRLVDAGKILGIRVLDHIILNALGEYYSFLEEDICFERSSN
ncbi:MAG: hypothetical protein CR988_02550 [Treponema sp.]|nr:MAG: hypothetical protein CR988_02550 [Treponema sp.]